MAGAFGPRKTHCKYGHSLEDAYVYKKKEGDKIKTIRECKPCSMERNRKYKDRKRKSAKRRKEREMKVSPVGLSCGHEIVFRPPPQPDDIVWCNRCVGYRIVSALNSVAV